MRHPIVINHPEYGEFRGIMEVDTVAGAVLREAWDLAGRPETADLPFFTDTAGNTYIGEDTAWMVSSDPRVARLVVAYYTLIGQEPPIWKARQVVDDQRRLRDEGILMRGPEEGGQGEVIRPEFGKRV